MVNNHCLVVTGTMEFWMIFQNQLGISWSQLTNSYFSEGLKPPTSYRNVNWWLTVGIFVFVFSYHMFMKNMSCHHLFICFSSKCPNILFSIQIFIEICLPRNRQEIPEDLRGRSSNHRQKGGLPRDGARRHAPHGLGGLSRCAAMSIQLGEIPMIHGFWNKIESQSIPYHVLFDFWLISYVVNFVLFFEFKMVCLASFGV